MHIIAVTEPNTPLNDADHVGSFNSTHQEVKCNNIKYVRLICCGIINLNKNAICVKNIQ